MANTIAGFIEPKLAQMLQGRLQRLQDLGAPAVVIAKAEAAVQEPLKQVSKVDQFGGLEFVDSQPKSYRRGQGVEFTLADGSHVWLIPGPYGLFLTNEAK